MDKKKLKPGEVRFTCPVCGVSNVEDVGANPNEPKEQKSICVKCLNTREEGEKK